MRKYWLFIGFLITVFLQFFIVPFISIPAVPEVHLFRDVFLLIIAAISLGALSWKGIHFGFILWLSGIVMLTLWGYLVIMFSPSAVEITNLYSQTKMLSFLALWGGMSIISYWTAYESPALLKKALKWNVWLYMGVAIIFILYTSGSYIKFYKVFRVLGTTYLSFGRLAGLGALVCLYEAIQEKRLVTKALSLLAAMIFLYFAFVLDSKGPLLSALLIAGGMGIAAFSNLDRKGKIFLESGLFAFFSVIIIAIGIVLANSPRIVMKSARETSFSSREDRYRVASQMFVAHPITGIGPGAFLSEYQSLCEVCPPKQPRRDYPHNIVLEVAAELGTVGLIIVTLIFLLPLLHYLFQPQIPEIGSLFLWLYLYALMVAQTSGDLPNNYWIAAFAGMMFGLTKRDSTSKSERL